MYGHSTGCGADCGGDGGRALDICFTASSWVCPSWIYVNLLLIYGNDGQGARSRRKTGYRGNKHKHKHVASGMCTASVAGTDVSVENTDCRRRGV